VPDYTVEQANAEWLRRFEDKHPYVVRSNRGITRFSNPNLAEEHAAFHKGQVIAGPPVVRSEVAK